MKLRDRNFSNPHHTFIMGILNVTPDSFSDGGRWNTIDSALRRVEQMKEDGMDIVDIGGESTRPGYIPISDQQEIDRIVPVIEAVSARFDLPISVDTYKSTVASEALSSGADMINDIWGLKHDAAMASLIAETGAACCLMHNRTNSVYQSFLPEVLSDLEESLALAKSAGIADDHILLDPGVGFAKSYEQNLTILHRLEELLTLGYPLLLGASRKSVIGLTLELPTEQRLEGTLAITALAVFKGCRFVRVHDVKENARVIRMLEAILQERKPEYGQ